jgi:hypothetical protein
MVHLRILDPDRQIDRAVSVVGVVILDRHFHRVTIEWSFDRQPDAHWVAAFNETAHTRGVMRSFVPSAYGTPMVLDNSTLVWSVKRGDLKASVAFVERAIAEANATVSSKVVPLRRVSVTSRQ